MKINSQEFDKIAREIFAPAYPAIARQIIENTGITRGTCLDIGSGGGYLGLSLALETELFVCFLDESPEMLDIAKKKLAPLGTAYIGGGFGSSAIKDEIAQKMEELDKGSGRWQRKVEKNLGSETSARLETALKAAQIQDFEISSNSETGLWVLFKKQKGIKCHQ